jgi:hypothetical protein
MLIYLESLRGRRCRDAVEKVALRRGWENTASEESNRAIQLAASNVNLKLRTPSKPSARPLSTNPPTP